MSVIGVLLQPLQKAERTKNRPELPLDFCIALEFHLFIGLGIKGGARQSRHSDLNVVAFALVKREVGVF